MEANLEYELAIERARDRAVEAQDPRTEHPIALVPIPPEEYRSTGTYLAETDEPQWTGWE